MYIFVFDLNNSYRYIAVARITNMAVLDTIPLNGVIQIVIAYCL